MCYPSTASAGSVSTLICGRCCVLRLIRWLKHHFGRIFVRKARPITENKPKAPFAHQKSARKLRRQALDGCGQDTTMTTPRQVKPFTQRLRECYFGDHSTNILFMWQCCPSAFYYRWAVPTGTLSDLVLFFTHRLPQHRKSVTKKSTIEKSATDVTGKASTTQLQSA